MSVRECRPTMFSRYFRHQGVERAQQRAGVLLQNLAIDIVNRVTGLVVAGIVRATSDAAEHAGLGLRFQSACPRVKVPSRVVSEFGDAISGISRVSGQAARSIG